MEERRTARAAGARRPGPAPFWTRLPAIALYPVQDAAFWSLIALTLCTLLGVLPGVGWVLLLVTWLAVYRYAFEILRHTAHGHPGAPEHGLDLFDGAVLRLFGLMVLFFAVALATLVFTRSTVLVLLVVAALALAQPGCVISLALDGSLRRALNPAVPLGLARRIGWPYLAAFGLLFVIQASALTAAAWLDRFLPAIVGNLAVSFVSIWGLFCAFHLLGYLVYQYHGALGFEPAALDGGARTDPDRALLDEAEARIHDGQPEAAREALRAAVRTRAVGLPVHDLYQRLLGQDGGNAELQEHARLYLGRLLDERREPRALALLREMLDRDPRFVPAGEEQAARLVERARAAGQLQLVADALLAMLETWPRSAQAPQWALEAGVLLSERFGRDGQARELLQRALAHSDDGEQRRRLEAALKAIPQPAGA